MYSGGFCVIAYLMKERDQVVFDVRFAPQIAVHIPSFIAARNFCSQSTDAAHNAGAWLDVAPPSPLLTRPTVFADIFYSLAEI